VRIIVATNKNFKQAIAEGDFRGDICHLLNEFKIELSLLSERPIEVARFVITL